MAAGRPLKFQSVAELEAKIAEYFKLCDERLSDYVTKDGVVLQISNPRPYTITGLACHLDTTRELLIHYEEKEKFSNTIRKAKMKIQNFVEESLWTPKIATGIIFNLTNNFGWKNTQNLEHTGKDGEAIKLVIED